LKELLTVLGLPAALAALFLFIQEKLPWIWFLAPLLLVLFFIAVVKSGVVFKIPYLDTAVDALEKGKASNNLVSKLRGIQVSSESGKSTVRASMQHSLDWMARWLGAKPWSFDAFDRSLNIAVLYPIAMLVGMWLFFNVGNLGNAVVIPATTVWKRYLYVILQIGVPIAIYLFLLKSKWPLRFKQLDSNVPNNQLFAFAGAFVVAVAGAGAGAVAGAFFLEWLREKIVASGKTKYKDIYLVLFTVCWLLFQLTVIAYFLPDYSRQKLTGSSATFILLVFLGIFPVCNAALDWISISLTRTFIQKYLNHDLKIYWFILWDLLTALLLTALLYVGVLAILSTLENWGWNIDAKGMVKAFKSDPLDPQASWITAMAVTNVMPTFLHLGIVFAAILTGMNSTQLASIANAFKPKTETSSILDADGKALSKSIPVETITLSKQDAQAALNYLYFDRWLGITLAASMVIACWPLFSYLLAWFLKFLPV
jgi:hypothetical protein